MSATKFFCVKLSATKF